MSSVDDRIVNMQWNSKQFTQGAAESKKALESVDTALANTGKGPGLSSMGSQVDGIAGKFSAMKVAGVTALATIVSKATSVGINLAKSLTLDPISEGFGNYETKINAVQTILANTADQGTKLKDVTKNLNDLNTYANKTVYNFSEMAKNIGTFTAAGVDLKTSTESIKGIANLAALSGSTSQQASSAMYQLSQAIAAGQVHLQDWNSVVNAGIGGAAFQKNLIQSALATGTLTKSQVHLGKTMADTTVNGLSFRQSLTPPPGGMSWLTSKALTTSLGTFTGDMTKAQLVAKGFAPATAKAILAQGKMATNAATQIKTFTQMFQALKEEVGTAYASIFEALFGNINQAKAFLSPLHIAIENGLTTPIYALAGVIKGWRKAGGFTYTLEGLGNIFKTIGNLVHPFVVAFQTIAPSTGKAGSGLASLSHGFAIVTGWLEKASEGANVITPVLISIFGVFGKLGAAAGVAVRGLAPLLPLLADLGKLGGGMAQQGADIASGLISGLLKGLNTHAIQAAVTDFANNIVTWAKSALGIHSPSTKFIEIGTNIIAGLVMGLVHGITAVGPAVGKVLSVLFSHFTGLFQGFSAMDWAGLFNAILTGSLIFAVKKMVDAFGTIAGIGKNINEVIEGVGKSLKMWQASLKAKIILEIAIAVGILTAAIIALSYIDPKKIAISLGAISTMMGTLTGSLLALSKIGGDKQIAVLATSMVLISGAMIQLAAAVAIFGNMDMGTLAKGLGAMAVALGVMVGGMLALSGIEGKLVSAGAAILVISAAMTALAAAVAAFGVQDMAQLGKGLGAMAIALALVVGSLGILSSNAKGVLAAATSIAIISGAMSVLAGVVLVFGKMDLKTLAKGFASLGVGLALMVAAMLVLGANAVGTVAAASAIAIMAASMVLISGVVVTLGSVPWSVAAKGLTVLAIALAIFLAAAAVASLGPVAIGLEVLGSSIALFGAGLFLAGTGVAAFAAGLAVLATVGTASTAVLIAAIHAFLAILPEIATQVAASVIAFLKVFANASTELRKIFDKIFENMIGVITDNIPVVVGLIVKLVTELLDGIKKIIPKYGEVVSTLIKAGLTVLKKAVPQYIDAGTTIILKVLQGFGDKLPKIVKAGGDLIIKFIKGLSSEGVKIANACGQAILDFLTGLDKAIVKYETPIIKEGGKIAKDIISGLVAGLKDQLGWSKIKSAVEAMAHAIPGWAKKVLGIASPSKVFHSIGGFVGAGMATGIQSAIPPVIKAAIQMANAILAEGNKIVLAAEKMASKQEANAARARTKAKIAEKEYKEAEKNANKIANQKGSTKTEKKEASQAAIKAKKRAASLSKLSDAAQKKSDRASQHAQNVQDFQNADLHGKGDIKSDLAVSLASRANQTLAKANAEAARGRELLKTNQKAGRALLDQARKDAAAAKDLAKQAEKAHKAANKYYAEEVDARIKQMEDDAAADEQAKKDQAAYDAADAQGKSDILTKRAEADDAKAAALKAQAEALVAQAKKLANTDAAQAMKLLDQAQQASDDAQAAADQAASERDQAQQVLGDNSTSTPDSGGGGSIQISQDVLRQAASAVDRYTASLAESMALAAAQQGVVQFVQNNNSPESLSTAEIYRQSKNLLSAAEVKMGANTNP